MEQVMKVINDNMDNEDLSVDMIAREVGLSRVHLHRRMKELTNQTPHAFIRNTRLQYAEKLLTHSNKTITDIMFSCGFSNPASFSTMFKNFYGSSPRDYMQDTPENLAFSLQKRPDVSQNKVFVTYRDVYDTPRKVLVTFCGGIFKRKAVTLQQNSEYMFQP